MKVVFICSTNASVVRRAISSGHLGHLQIEFVSDRQCGAIEFAKEIGAHYKLLASETGKEFSELLCNHYSKIENSIFVTFYTRLLTEPFVDQFTRKIVNFHPSILPSFSGMHGFEDTIASGARFIGSTVHFIDQGMDTGRPIIQTAYPRAPYERVDALRHRIYLQQSVTLIQVLRWFEQGKIQFDEESNMVEVIGSEYCVGEFSPNLESELIFIYHEWLKHNE